MTTNTIHNLSKLASSFLTQCDTFQTSFTRYRTLEAKTQNWNISIWFRSCWLFCWIISLRIFLTLNVAKMPLSDFTNDTKEMLCQRSTVVWPLTLGFQHVESHVWYLTRALLKSKHPHEFMFYFYFIKFKCAISIFHLKLIKSFILCLFFKCFIVL